MRGTNAEHDGKEIRRRRVLRGWSLEQLAAKSDLHTKSLNNIELGHKQPSIKALRRIADALQCEVGDLLKDQPQTQPEEATV